MAKRYLLLLSREEDEWFRGPFATLKEAQDQSQVEATSDLYDAGIQTIEEGLEALEDFTAEVVIVTPDSSLLIDNKELVKDHLATIGEMEQSASDEDWKMFLVLRDKFEGRYQSEKAN